jgi:hypothetical protein
MFFLLSSCSIGHIASSLTLTSLTKTDADCVEMRGNLFYPQNSSTWRDLGLYYFTVDKQLGNYGYGDYGLESLTFGSTGVTLPSALISVFNGSGPTNTTSYFDGMFGVGITPGTFNGTVPLPAINALVEQDAAILSHSYGFTAGAVYRKTSGSSTIVNY